MARNALIAACQKCKIGRKACLKRKAQPPVSSQKSPGKANNRRNSSPLWCDLHLKRWGGIEVHIDDRHTFPALKTPAKECLHPPASDITLKPALGGKREEMNFKSAKVVERLSVSKLIWNATFIKFITYVGTFSVQTLTHLEAEDWKAR